MKLTGFYFDVYYTMRKRVTVTEVKNLDHEKVNSIRSDITDSMR